MRSIDSVHTPAEYRQLRRQVTWDHAMVLVLFAERAATLAVKQDDERLLVAGLIAVLLAGFDRDEEATLSAAREPVLIIPLLLKSAKKMGVKVRRLISQVSPIVGEDTALILRKFCAQSPWQRSLKAMGYRETPGNALLYDTVN